MEAAGVMSGRRLFRSQADHVRNDTRSLRAQQVSGLTYEFVTFLSIPESSARLEAKEDMG
jgi:hypothetical protein